MDIVGFVSRHPVAVAVVAAFGAFQIVLCWWLRNRLYRLCQRFDADQMCMPESDASNEVSEASSATGWPIRICHQLRMLEQSEEPFDRDAALADFDRWIGSFYPYGMLHRTAVMAPLLGVMITAAGFLQLQLPDVDDSVSRIVETIMPLILGVGSGAALAFFNQILLQLSDGFADATRASAERWLDNRLRDIGQRRRRIHGTDELLEELRAILSENAGRNQTLVSAVEQVAGELKTIASDFARAMNSLDSQVGRLPRQVASVEQAVRQAVANCEDWTESIGKNSETLESAVRLFHTTCTEVFAPMGGEQLEAATNLNRAAREVKEMLQTLRASSETIQSIVERQDRSTKALDEMVTEDLVPKYESIHTMIEHIDEAVNQLVTPISELEATLSDLVSARRQLVSAAEEMQSGASAFAESVDSRFVPAADLHHDAQTGAKESTTQLVRSLEALAKTMASHQQSLREFHDSIQQHAVPSSQLLHRATTQLDTTTEELAEHTQGFGESTAAVFADLKTAVASFEKSVGQIQAFLDKGIEPLKREMDDLAATCSELAPALGDVPSVQRLTTEIQNLTNAMTQVARVFKSSKQPTEHNGRRSKSKGFWFFSRRR